MTKYVVGFLFVEGGNRVALIKKQRPAWQFGRLNGIGGKIEPDESPLEAMRREFKEETWLDVEDWRAYAVLTAGEAKIHFFTASRPTADLQSVTDELVDLYRVQDLGHLPIIRNLAWLIPLALDPNNVQVIAEETA